MTKITEKSDAALINHLGNVVGIVLTAQRAGLVSYYRQETIEGNPVNCRTGKISRSKRNLEAAYRQPDPCGYYLTKEHGLFVPEY